MLAILFRQTHVEPYSPRLAALRPLYNLAARCSPLKPMPRVDARVPYLYLACVALRDNAPELLRCLLRGAYKELRRGPWHYAIIGLHEADPLAAVLDDYRQVAVAGRLHVVHYHETADVVARLRERVPYVEAGCL